MYLDVRGGGCTWATSACIRLSPVNIIYIYTVESVHMRFADIGRLNMAEMSVLCCQKVRNWND